jgi:transposase
LISLEKWQDIRERGIGKQESIKQISRETGVAINTIRKCLRSSSPLERRGAPTRTSMMTAYENDVDALLKQEPRITSARVAQVLREKDSTFALRERAVRLYVAQRRLLMHPKEVFIRQAYVPGEQTQYDFKDVKAIIAGEEIELHLFMARLSHSTAWFGHCYRTEDQPALFDGFLRAAVEFHGVTCDGVFDNPKTAVVKVLRGRHRKVNAEFAAFTGSLAIDMQFAAPAKGNEKGGVEGAHGYVEDNFFRPMRSAESIEALNEELLAFSRADREHRNVDGHTVAQRLEFERAALKPLPEILPRPCVYEHVRINKFAEVHCRTNRYSVPTQFVGRPATIEVFADRVRIIVDDELAAEWARLFGRNDAALDPLHYLHALKRKHRAVERAAVFQNERFPEALRALLKRLIHRDRDTAGKQFMRVIELLVHHRMAEVVTAVELATEQGVDDPAAIALLLEQRSSAEPQSLVLGLLPQAAQIAAPQALLDGYSIAELKEVAA